MKATVTSITGFYEAFVSMFMSKRTWTPELNEEIKTVCSKVVDANGKLYENQEIESYSSSVNGYLCFFVWAKDILQFLGILILRL